MLNSVFLSVIERSLAVCFLIACVLVLRVLFRKAPRRMLLLLWIPVVLRLLSPVTVQSRFSLIPSSLTESLFSFFQPENENEENKKPDIAATLPSGNNPAGITPGGNGIHNDTHETLPGQTNPNQTPANSGTKPDGADGSQTMPSAAQPAQNPDNFEPLPPSGSETAEPKPSSEKDATDKISLMQWLISSAPILWLAGILLLAGYIALETFRIRRLIKDTHADKVDGIPVYFGKQIPTPFLYGFLTPRIYLPEGLSEKHLSFVVAHEEMHKKGKDNLLKPFAFLIATIYWFHPLVWLAYALFCKDLELACDEQVLSTLDADGRKEYLQALLAIGTMPHSSKK